LLFFIKYILLGADVSARVSRFLLFKPQMNADMNPHCGANISFKKRSCFAFFANFAVKSVEYLLFFKYALPFHSKAFENPPASDHQHHKNINKVFFI